MLKIELKIVLKIVPKSVKTVKRFACFPLFTHFSTFVSTPLRWVVLRVPYPMGFYTKWLDGRIDHFQLRPDPLAR